MTAAIIGYGSTIAKGNAASPEVFSSALAEVVSMSFSGQTRDTPEASHMQSPDRFREFVKGMVDGGELTCTLNFIPGNATQTTVQADFATNVVSNWRITFPGSPAETLTFAGIITNDPWEASFDAKMEQTVSFKITGKPTYA